MKTFEKKPAVTVATNQSRISKVKPPVSFSRLRSMSISNELLREPTYQLAAVHHKERSQSIDRDDDAAPSEKSSSASGSIELKSKTSDFYCSTGTKIDNSSSTGLNIIKQQSAVSVRKFQSTTNVSHSDHTKSLPREKFQQRCAFFELQAKLQYPTISDHRTQSLRLKTSKSLAKIELYDQLDFAKIQPDDRQQEKVRSRASTITSIYDSRPTVIDEKRANLEKCREEVHKTEISYVEILKVLVIDLPRKVQIVCGKDNQLIKRFEKLFQPLLNALLAIFNFHNRSILPAIGDYLVGERENYFWTIFENHFRTIEELYSTYYIIFDDVQQNIEEFVRNNSLIGEAMLVVQTQLGNLYPITQLNCANQRLLRYLLLIKSYTENLDVDTSEYKKTKEILDQMDRIAESCQEKLMISSSRFDKLRQQLDQKIQSMDHENLLWHGSLKKQSTRRFVDLVPRYLILLSRSLLICRESGSKLEFKIEIPLKDITVDRLESRKLSSNNSKDPLNNMIFYPFQVNSIEKSYEFLADKESTRQVWLEKLSMAVKQNQKKILLDKSLLGTRTPCWVNDTDVSRCQLCHDRFRSNLLSSTRHHCRSCGRCICEKCSSEKILLEYCKNLGEVRVCDACYAHFKGSKVDKSISKNVAIMRKPDQTILFGNFFSHTTESTVWIALEEDYQLHIYGAELDQAQDYVIPLFKCQKLMFSYRTRTIVCHEDNKIDQFSIENSHRLKFSKNDDVYRRWKESNDKLSFCTQLWFEAIQLAKKKSYPDWYIKKRTSADSGVSVDL